MLTLKCIIAYNSGGSIVADFSIYFSSENPTTTKQASFGVKGPTAGSGCGVSSSLLSPSYSYSGSRINDQTLDVQAYNIPLTDLGIYMGNDYGGGTISSWAGSVVIMTSPYSPSSSPTVKPSSPTATPSSSSPSTYKPSRVPSTYNPSRVPSTYNPSSVPSTYGATYTVDLASLGTISSCVYIQIPFSETGSILRSITFSGVSQSKLCIVFMIYYHFYVC